MVPVLLPTTKVLALCDPLRQSPWEGRGRVTAAMVRFALKTRRYRAEPVPRIAAAREHASRIAYLVERGWDDAIDIDVGIPSMHCYVRWPVQDGNHRLAAAAFRQDAGILAVVGGDLDYALDLFGVECEENYPEKESQ